jgi:hypothetical protein
MKQASGLNRVEMTEPEILAAARFLLTSPRSLLVIADE